MDRPWRDAFTAFPGLQRGRRWRHQV